MANFESYCTTCTQITNGNANNCDGCNPTDSGAPTKYVKNEKKMVIIVIGSVKVSEINIRTVAKYFEDFGHVVYTPLDEETKHLPLIAIQRLYIDKIKASDLIVVVPKKNILYDVEIGESTSYEIAMAKYFGKPIVYWQAGGII